MLSTLRKMDWGGRIIASPILTGRPIIYRARRLGSTSISQVGGGKKEVPEKDGGHVPHVSKE